jgi:hypothetical protein
MASLDSPGNASQPRTSDPDLPTTQPIDISALVRSQDARVEQRR